ncbi:MAG: YebC/PmpR family DNA-binding transcriptional regulator [Acidimicrobiaceae bacterium]|nr:YebC/PmpR family DNA-binding transcriptional regulator [Ilumatobacter sp.]MCB9380218.1 YebC/PmpR family DNA-binding transcriptional regulator [Acidimicrobiaceae bacterium]MCO5329364.1 YebC/PmpR family DNA-binding transcriptional regulator [Ilumatobacteraceae bacterium]
MSGHSKWATIKHKKGAADKARAKVFNKIARQLEVAAREGGPDPTSNASLRNVILKAKAAQMTNDAIDRAVKRGAGVNDGGNYETIMYEGYAPGGVAMLIDVLTDNRNRTSAEVRNIFNKMGGAMAEPGAVGWQFSRKGVIYVTGGDEDTVMMAALEAGAEDITADDDGFRVTTDPSGVYEVRDALHEAGLTIASAESTMVSSVTIEVTDTDDARKILRIMDALEDNDDVQDVYSNFDISAELMEAVGG